MSHSLDRWRGNPVGLRSVAVDADLAEQLEAMASKGHPECKGVVLALLSKIADYQADRRRMDWLEENAYAIETRESGSGHKPEVSLRDWIDNALSTEQLAGVPNGDATEATK